MSGKIDLDKILSVKEIKNQSEFAKNNQRIDHAIELFEEITKKAESKPHYRISKIRVDRDLYYPIATDMLSASLSLDELEDWKERVVIEDWEAIARRELFYTPKIETQKTIPNCTYYELEFEVKECEDCNSKPLYDEIQEQHYCPICES